jgi:sugar/nucleoside kinase (ribokinase family)
VELIAEGDEQQSLLPVTLASFASLITVTTMKLPQISSLTIFGTIEFCRSRFANAHYSPVYIGGNGVLASLAAGKRIEVDLIGVIGTDMKRTDLAYALGQAVHIENVEQLEGKSFYYQATYDPETFELAEEDVAFGVHECYHPWLAGGRAKSSQCVLFSGSNPRLGLAVLKQMERPRVVGVNTLLYHLKHNEPYAIGLTKTATHLFTNSQEYDYLTSKIGKDLFRSCERLQYIFKTRGISGVEVMTPADIRSFPLARVVRPQDSTNAGDVFAGTVMGMVVRGHDPEKELHDIVAIAQEESAKVILNDSYYRKEFGRKA